MSECWHDQSDSLIASGVMEMVYYQASVPWLTTYGRLLCYAASLHILGDYEQVDSDCGIATDH